MANYVFLFQLLTAFTIPILTTASPVDNETPVDLVSRDVANENDFMSAKYPGKYWNSLAEAADTVEYSVPKQLNPLHKRTYYVSCDGGSVVSNGQCEQYVKCNGDGSMNGSGIPTTLPDLHFYCQVHCDCYDDHEEEVRTDIPIICGKVYCNTQHTWCLKDGTVNGCDTVTISRSRNQKNRVKGSLRVEHEYGDWKTIGWEIGLNHESVTISATSIGALAILFILF